MLEKLTVSLDRLGDTLYRMQLIADVLAVYARHGWNLRRALLRPEIIVTLTPAIKAMLDNTQIIESDFDGLWFSRPSHSSREAWELRLLSETPYALFEAFEPDESEEQRENKRREIEARMRLHKFPKT